MVEKKEKVLSTRVSERFYNYLQRKANELDIKSSNFIRDAIAYYVRFIDFHGRANNPMLLFSKSEISFLINQVDEESLERLAQICYENGVLTRRFYVKELSNGKEIEDINIGVRAYIKMLNESVFSKKGQYWFNEVRYRFKEGNEFRFVGKHDLNLNFSIFIKYFMKKHLVSYSYELMEEDLKDEKCILVFRKKKEE